jgi:hypothetical protein
VHVAQDEPIITDWRRDALLLAGTDIRRLLARADRTTG